MLGPGGCSHGITLARPAALGHSICLLLLGFPVLQDAGGSTPGPAQLSILPNHPGHTASSTVLTLNGGMVLHDASINV